MSRVKEISIEEKLRIIKLCSEERKGNCQAGTELRVEESTVLGWVYKYEAERIMAFVSNCKQKHYPPEVKKQQ